MDIKLGASCFLCMCWKIKQDGTIYISFQVNHGKRKGQEHFIKLISWGGFDNEGNPVVKIFCVDASRCGHSTREAAESFKETLELIRLLIPEIIADSIMSDSGGGAAVQNILKVLIEMGVLSHKTIKNHCECHTMNNPIEIAFKGSLGDAGINTDAPALLISTTNQHGATTTINPFTMLFTIA